MNFEGHSELVGIPISIALDLYWRGVRQAVDIIAAFSALGAVGGLPAFLNALVKRMRAPVSGSPIFQSRAIAVLFGIGLLALEGCVPATVRSEVSSAGNVPHAIRTLGIDGRFSSLSSESVASRVLAQQAGMPLNILALSGGGAGGAFGAGALVGLTQSALRPPFSVVTGVSAGALIAPYAFLGPDWDNQLIEVYTSGRAEHLLQPRGLGALFGSSVYSGAPLKDLVDRYATDALIQAIAHEASSGRLLLVATTDVSTGESVIWDLGSIAMNGGAGARKLFREVLVASASVPGLFPPVVIRVQEQQALYEEVHVDGMIAVPFFVPHAFVAPAQDSKHPPRGATVYVIVDGQLSEQPAPIRLRARWILTRSVTASLNHMLRTTLELTATDVQLEGAQLRFAAIPLGYPDLNSFDFRTQTMRSLFQFGYRCAEANRLWTQSQSAGRESSTRTDAGTGQQCPADDELIGRLAVR